MFLHITLLLNIFWMKQKNTALNAEQSVKSTVIIFYAFFGYQMFHFLRFINALLFTPVYFLKTRSKILSASGSLFTG